MNEWTIIRFRNARTLRWNRATVFTPGHSADGTLYADDDPDGLPFDTYTTAEASAELADLAWKTRSGEPHLVTLPSGVRVFPEGWSDQVTGIVADSASLSELHDAVRDWCRDSLGRGDIEFTVRAQDGTFETVDPAG